MIVKRFRMFCWPNGSGKSTLINEIEKDYNLGYFINADIIKSRCNTRGFLNVSDFCSSSLSQHEWLSFLNLNSNDDRNKNLFLKINIEDNILVCSEPINSYEAAVLATFFRERLVEGENTFSFETVMSHQSKLDFLLQAKHSGFKIYFYYVCTQDPQINLLRVKNRVKKGGHDVDENKILNRYYRSLDLLFNAFNIADRAFLLDNSSQKRSLMLEKKSNQSFFKEQNIPAWIFKYLIDKY